MNPPEPRWSRWAAAILIAAIVVSFLVLAATAFAVIVDSTP